ncbi:MAG: ribonuclease HII [Bacteroidales bacterium]|jgi:ribonuclease HII|nr:ribonuclease HII [Bacteroidales bacterium]
MLFPYYKNGVIEAGCDEAGRGPLAGPVFAAAVILPEDYCNPELDDSKKLSEKKRNALREQIENDSIAYSVAFCTNEEIDSINILNASILAMHRALDGLSVRPEFIIIDGNRFKNYKDVPHATIIKGDGKYLSIAAASILAKTYRDAYMDLLHRAYPKYGWDRNRAYPTVAHYKAIAENGVTPFHRQSFRLYG